MNKRLENLLIALVLVGLSAFAYFVYFAGDRQTGIYEHIRKAEEYFEKGKHEKALSVLHQAYEDSPKSEKMKSLLMNGYVKYARQLNSQGDLDIAIDYMDMAYEMAPKSSLVINELAYLYSKKAIELSKQEDYVLAIRTMQKSTDLAVKSKKIRRNIANSLYNGAVNAYNENDGTTVLLCLNSSYMLWPRFETLQLFGQYFYRDNNLDNALFYWEKALEIRPDDADMKEKVVATQKGILANMKMRVIEMPHFDIQFYKEYDVDIGILRGVLKDIYSEVGQDLGYYPPSGTKMIFYTEEDFREIFRKEGIIRGFYDGSIRVALSEGIKDEFLISVMAHEYTHVVVSILTDNMCPVWLHEGIAVVEQSRYTPVPFNQVKDVVKEGRRLTIQQLQDGFSDMTDQEALQLSYGGSYEAAMFILDRWGWAGLRRLLDAIKREGHFSNALDEEFYISVETFQGMWNEYLHNKYVMGED